MTASNKRTLYFPIGDDLGMGLALAAVSHRDGTPVEWIGKVPVYAHYYLVDEFETPILDPSLAYFLTPNECLFVAQHYIDLVKAGDPMPDRTFSAAYAAYFFALRRLPDVITKLRKHPNGMPANAYLALMRDFTDPIVKQK